MDQGTKKDSLTIRISAQDRMAIEAIQHHFGFLTSNDTVRYSLRHLQREVEREQEKQKLGK